MLSLHWYKLGKKKKKDNIAFILNPVNHITVHGKKFHKLKQAEPKTMLVVF